jgi:hypothetical protein
MIIAAASTGVTIASIRIVSNKPIVMNGIMMRLFLKPLAVRVRRVISKLVKEIVVLTPAKITEKINTSCPPTPVYFVLEEKGAIKVQPAVVCTLSEHLATDNLCRFALITFSAEYQ